MEWLDDVRVDVAVVGAGVTGLAAALALAEDFADGAPICVILGDNILERSIRPAVERYARRGGGRGGLVLLKEVPDPERFGVPVLEGERLVRIEEKPKRPASRYAVIGVYMYDARVFEIIRTLKPSGRNELEITDVNNAYLGWGELDHAFVDGWWTDAGAIESLYRATSLIAKQRAEAR